MVAIEGTTNVSFYTRENQVNFGQCSLQSHEERDVDRDIHRSGEMCIDVVAVDLFNEKPANGALIRLGYYTFIDCVEILVARVPFSR